VLDKSNVLGLFSEALSADVKTVFADETGLVCANATFAGTLSVGTGSGEVDGFVRHGV